MLTSTKFAFAGLGALALYLALSPSTAKAASPPGSAMPPLPAGTVPTGVDAKTAGLYVGSESGGAIPTVTPSQIAVIARRAATNDGFLVYFINKHYTMYPGETIFAYVLDETGAVLHTLVFSAGLQPQQTQSQVYTVVGYTLNAKQTVYDTVTKTLGDPAATILATRTNGSSDGSVQRADALNLLSKSADLAYAGIYYDGDALAVDPDTGRDFVVARI